MIIYEYKITSPGWETKGIKCKMINKIAALGIHTFFEVCLGSGSCKKKIWIRWYSDPGWQYCEFKTIRMWWSGFLFKTESRLFDMFVMQLAGSGLNLILYMYKYLIILFIADYKKLLQFFWRKVKTIIKFTDVNNHRRFVASKFWGIDGLLTVDHLK